MQCPECGRHVDGGVAECPYCGEEFLKGEGTASRGDAPEHGWTRPAAASQRRGTSQSYPRPTGGPEYRPTSRSSPLLVGLGLIVVAGVIGIGILFTARITGPQEVETDAAVVDGALPASGEVVATPLPGQVGTDSVPGDVVTVYPSATLPTPTTSAVPDDETAAAELADYRSRDIAATAFDGRWVAQLASKAPGITDDLATTASGSHVFYAPDILTEHERLRATVSGRVFLLSSTDYGQRQLWNGQPMWVTFADNGFGSKGDVDSWCRSQFAGLSAEELTNACVPRQMNPPR